MICGYAEILKHSIIKDKFFFNWLKKNTRQIFLKKPKYLIFAIKKVVKLKCFLLVKMLMKGLKNEIKLWSYLCSCN